MTKEQAEPKFDVSFPISKEEYDYYLANKLSHRDFYKLGQEAHRKENSVKEPKS